MSTQKLKVYTTRGSPPSSTVLATLAALGISCEEIQLDFMAGEHLTPEHEKRNPQRELPVLEDNGFYLSESVSIMQYLCEQYGGEVGDNLFPKDPKKRAVVNQRLLFNLGSLYPGVSDHTFGDVFGTVVSTENRKAKCLKVLSVFETILSRQGTRFAAGDSVTIADISLLSSVICLDAVKHDTTSYPKIVLWYETVQKECPKIWQIMKSCRDDLRYFFNNPPDKASLEKLEKLRQAKQ